MNSSGKRIDAIRIAKRRGGGVIEMQEQMGIFAWRHLSSHKGVCFEFVYFAKQPVEAIYERMKPKQ